MTIAIPNALGVPGFWNEGPNWWDAAQPSPPPQWNTLDDPRWSGSLQITYNAGTLEVAALRALHDADALYFSFQVSADPSLDDQQDTVYLGLQGPSGTAYVLEVEAFSSAAAASDENLPASTLWTLSGGTWSSSSPPAWLAQYGRAWVTPSGMTTTNNQWAVNLRVPLLFGATVPDPDLTDDGIYLGASIDSLAFNIWLVFQVDTPSGYVYFYWPRTGAQFGGGLQFAPAAPSTWDSVTSVVGTSGGLYFAPADIGCRYDPADPTEIGASTTANTPNPLYVMVHNSSGATAPMGTIDASFRIANWGAQGDFTASPAATEWMEIHPEVTKSNGSDIPNGGVGEVDYTWNLTPTEAEQYVPAGTAPLWTHECMLVTLTTDPSSSTQYVFLNDSCYRNMHIVGASVFEEKVEFNVLGLDEYAVGEHVSVYVYVERDNMPENIPGGTTSSGAEFDQLFGKGGEIPERATVSWEVAATRVPTVVYHVFAGTNVRVLRHGREQEILAPMTSFGSFVRHDGPLYGWDVGLDLAGLTEIAPNWYRVHVPKGGRLIGSTMVRAWETKRPAGCLSSIVSFLEKCIAAIRKLLK
jgi:hypothetical protein